MDCVIVLNADDSFLHYTRVYRAWQLLKQNKAMPYHPEIKNITVRTFSGEILIPTVIRLLDYVRRKFKGHVDCKKRNIFIRDNFTCCYCNKVLTPSMCTVDHIIPKDQGGQTIWENVVTSCGDCNSYKRNRTPSQAKMKMHFKVFQPTIMEFTRLKIQHEGIMALVNDLIG